VPAVQYKIPYVTAMAAAEAAGGGMEAVKNNKSCPASWQEYHEKLKEQASAGQG